MRDHAPSASAKGRDSSAGKKNVTTSAGGLFVSAVDVRAPPHRQQGVRALWFQPRHHLGRPNVDIASAAYTHEGDDLVEIVHLGRLVFDRAGV